MVLTTHASSRTKRKKVKSIFSTATALFSCGAGLELAMRRVIRRHALPLVLVLVLHSLAALQEVSSDATVGSAAAGVNEAREFASLSSPSVPTSTRLGRAGTSATPSSSFPRNPHAPSWHPRRAQRRRAATPHHAQKPPPTATEDLGPSMWRELCLRSSARGALQHDNGKAMERAFDAERRHESPAIPTNDELSTPEYLFTLPTEALRRQGWHATTGGCQMGYMNCTGCHQLRIVLSICPTPGCHSRGCQIIHMELSCHQLTAT